MQIQTNAEHHVSLIQKLSKQIKVITSMVHILYFQDKESNEFIIYGVYDSPLLAEHYQKRAIHEGYLRPFIVSQEFTSCKEVR